MAVKTLTFCSSFDSRCQIVKRCSISQKRQLLICLYTDQNTTGKPGTERKKNEKWLYKITMTVRLCKQSFTAVICFYLTAIASSQILYLWRTSNFNYSFTWKVSINYYNFHGTPYHWMLPQINCDYIWACIVHKDVDLCSSAPLIELDITNSDQTHLISIIDQDSKPSYSPLPFCHKWTGKSDILNLTMQITILLLSDYQVMSNTFFKPKMVL